MRDLAFLLWPFVCAFAIWRFAQIAERAIVTYRGGDIATPNEPVVLPPDLVAFVATFNSEWARADAKKAILERYEQAHDWNVVRRAVGVGVMN